MVMNVAQTDFPLIKTVACRVFNFKLKKYYEDMEGSLGPKKEQGDKLSSKWDLTWHDKYIAPEFLMKVQPH